MEENITVPEKTPDEKKKENKNAAVGCLFIVTIIVLLIWVFYPKGERGTNIDAYVTAKAYVEKRLKSSATAKFADYSENLITKIGQDSLIIHSYVDSQNGFGAMIRSKFVIQMHKKGDDWYCDYFQIE